MKLGHLKLKIQKFILKYFRIYIHIEKIYNTGHIPSVIDFLKRNRPITTEYDLIRVGGTQDGGYLIPNDLKGIKYCYSPGVDVTSDFELDLYEKFNIHSYLSDFSVDKPGIDCDGFKFQKKFLDSKTNKTNDTLSDWIRKENNDDEMILQMDVEGFEYDVLIETSSEVLKKFRIILIEFHSFNKIYSEFGFRTIKSIFDKLNKNFYIVHIHPNKCCGYSETKGLKTPNTIEYTFLRKDRVKYKKNNEKFPHELDHDKNFILPSNFYNFS
tara:strand:+ start:367 stop:1173 length:807 start_codon:yes stop_codon:yes gene_type:complete